MTTLPQTTPLRLPRPASTTQLSIPSSMLPAGVAPATMAPQMTGGDVWRVLRANLWLIILLLIVSAVAGYGINRWLEKNMSSYTAQAYVQVQAPPNTDPARANQPPPMDLALLNSQLKNEERFMTDAALFSSVLTSDNAEVHNSKWYRQFYPNTQAMKEDLKKNFHVASVLESRLLAVSMTASDAKSAQTMLKAVVEEHFKFEKERNSTTEYDELKQLHIAEAFYLGARDRVGAKITEIQNDLSEAGGGGGNGGISIKEMQLQQLTEKISDVDVGLASAKEELETTQQAINNDQDPPRVAAGIAADATVVAAKNSVDDLNLAIEQNRPNYDENSQVMTELNLRLRTEEKKLAQISSEARVRMRNSVLEDAKQRYEEMLRIQGEEAKSLKKLQQDMGDLAQKRADLTLNQNEFTGYESKLKAVQDQLDQIAQYTQKQEVSSVAWWREPEIPEVPSFPKLGVTMTLAIGVGLVLALGIAFLREFMDTTIRSPRDISRVGNMNLLGMVPHEDDDPQSAGARLPVVIFEAPHSMMAEQLRQVRTRLQHSSSLDSNRSILVTSPSPGDGKSTIACNLASGLALNGRRILLVDANFRRPELHRVFNLGNDQGFSDVLNSLDLFEHAVQETQVPNLYILPSGPKPTNATELLESQLLLDFIERALEEFDHVIFDSGPLLFVSETVALAPRVDGVVTVVRARTNSRGVLSRMRDTLKQVKAEHLGVVLNAVRAQGGGYYGRNIRTYYEYQNGGPA